MRSTHKAIARRLCRETTSSGLLRQGKRVAPNAYIGLRKYAGNIHDQMYVQACMYPPWKPLSGLSLDRVVFGPRGFVVSHRPADALLTTLVAWLLAESQKSQQAPRAFSGLLNR